MRHEHKAKVNPRARSLLEARAHDPFGVLGMHRHGNHDIVGIFEPHAERAWVRDGHEWREMQPEGDGLNGGGVSAEPIAWMSRPYSGPATLPPLAGSLLAPESHGL